MKLLICTQAMDKNHPILGFFHRWVEEFAKHCEVIHVICLIEGEHTLPANVYVHSLGKEHGKNRLRELWRFYVVFGRLFFSGKIDHVFYHMGAVYNIVGAPFYILRKINGIKFYWWKAHGHTTLTEKLALMCCERVYTPSRLSFPVDTKKKWVIGHAVVVPEEVPDMQKVSGTLLVLGRVSPVKKVEYVIDVVSQLQKQGQSVHLEIIGAQPDDTYKQFLAMHAAQIDVSDKVSFRGGVTHSEISRYLSTAMVLVHTSKTDSIDKVVLEAMAHGTVPVSTCIAFKELLEPYGLYTTVEELADTMLKVLQLSPAAYTTLVQKLRAEVAERHSVSTMYNRIFNPIHG